MLKFGGRFLLVEPKGHVGQGDFEREVAAAQAAGLSIQARLRIAISRATLFSR